MNVWFSHIPSWEEFFGGKPEPRITNRRCWSKVTLKKDKPVLQLTTPAGGVIASAFQMEMAAVHNAREVMAGMIFDYPNPGDFTEARNQDEAQ